MYQGPVRPDSIPPQRAPRPHRERALLVPRTQLPPEVIREYKAAGILVYCENPSLSRAAKIKVMLGQQINKKQKGYKIWMDFGGKKEPEDNENPERTALREFSEETDNYWPSQLELSHHCFYNKKAKYVQYFLRVPWNTPCPSFRTEEVIKFDWHVLDYLKADGALGVIDLGYRITSLLNSLDLSRVLATAAGI
jgi:hypothetical protein